MEKDKNKLKQINRNTGYKVPEDYFENLNDRIMSHLPAIEIKEKTPVSLWQKCKPWIYMAAMFAGISLMIKTFVTPNPSADQVVTTTQADTSSLSESAIDDYIFYSHVDDYTIYEYLAEEKK